MLSEEKDEDGDKIYVFPDMRVRIIHNIFMVNMFFCVACILFASGPYYHYTGQAKVGLGAAISCSVFFYALACVTLWYNYNFVCCAFLAFWCITLGLSVGFLSALILNITPILLFVQLFAQSVALVCYTGYYPRRVITQSILAWMICACILAWCMAFYAFIVESDWPFGVLLLGISALFVWYNLRRIERTKGSYDASTDQLVLACLHYYCEDVISIVKKIKLLKP